jgi:hemoglobin-like flavoprotein
VPRTCTVCSHPKRSAIEKALVAGEPFRDIARRVAVSKDALARHRAEHLPPRLAKATEAKEVTSANNLLEQIRTLLTKALGYQDQAEKAKDLRTALLANREARANLELLAELTGKLAHQRTVNVQVSLQWQKVCNLLFEVLRAFPEARAAAASCLTAWESSHGTGD